ncbi:MAG: aminoglycoside phosphotransferase family protein [Alphaproteobacteria bacterium]|nr:aminoglycoside phosphotransferase family protein [Alphaproteobacteria bacterium]
MAIQRPDLETAKQILINAYKLDKIPFKPESVEPYCQGGSALVLKCTDIDGIEYAVRFPNTEYKLNNILSEIKILNFLQSEELSKKSGLDIPEPHYVPDDTFPFFWHKAIVGETLLPNKYNILNEKQKNNLARKIAKFLLSIHSCAKKPQIPNYTEYDKFLLGQIRLNSFEELKRNIPQNIFNKYNKMKINIDYPDTVCHFDMHGRNMAINPQTKELVGIFDFGDTRIQKCFMDFYKLSFVSRNLTRRVINEYNKISNIKINLDDVDIAYLCDIANKLKKYPDDGICNTSLKNFSTDVIDQQLKNQHSVPNRYL